MAAIVRDLMILVRLILKTVTSGRIQTGKGQKGAFQVAGNVLYLSLVCGYRQTNTHTYM